MLPNIELLLKMWSTIGCDPIHAFSYTTNFEELIPIPLLVESIVLHNSFIPIELMKSKLS